MHKALRKHLETAKGSAEQAVVIFIDVRGFTSFAGVQESINAALFLRRIYLRILSDFFPNCTFFKLTGDGMMIIREIEEDSLELIVNDSIEKCMELEEQFAQLCAGDLMINFNVPEKIGIGIARGAVTRLSSHRTILDYSGRPLNLAARLMDIARPSGIVFGTESVVLSVVNESLLNEFVSDEVYIKGIAEKIPLKIHYLKSQTKIQESSHVPINQFVTKRMDFGSVTFKELATRNRYFYAIPEKPDLLESCTIHFTFPRATPSGKMDSKKHGLKDYKVTYSERAGEHFIYFDFDPFVAELRRSGIKSTWSIEVVMAYQMIDRGRLIEAVEVTSATELPPF